MAESERQIKLKARCCSRCCSGGGGGGDGRCGGSGSCCCWCECCLSISVAGGRVIILRGGDHDLDPRRGQWRRQQLAIDFSCVVFKLLIAWSFRKCAAARTSTDACISSLSSSSSISSSSRSEAEVGGPSKQLSSLDSFRKVTHHACSRRGA